MCDERAAERYGLVELPEPLGLLRREGWAAVDMPILAWSADRISYERALAEALIQVYRDWAAFWAALRAACPPVAAELAERLAGEPWPAWTPPLGPLSPP